ncbi:Hypothetical_protein [Hexamita inflata]|uniref:Hypothetical_protein n=1 Tax=Hexamita inflata TaxID=28002 RepID=A0AA86P5L1_9EUKA|nr:Hypothetical protein HINF_LOCUS19490 [Hexamita inflata]
MNVDMLKSWSEHEQLAKSQANPLKQSQLLTRSTRSSKELELERKVQIQQELIEKLQTFQTLYQIDEEKLKQINAEPLMNQLNKAQQEIRMLRDENIQLQQRNLQLMMQLDKENDDEIIQNQKYAKMQLQEMIQEANKLSRFAE